MRWQGNAAFKAGDFPAAIGHYTSAILSDRKDPTYPLNRAAAYLKLGKYVQNTSPDFLASTVHSDTWLSDSKTQSEIAPLSCSSSQLM